MFESEDFLQFIFANEQDTYYCNGLLTLNLEQYLWFKLHEQGYGCVYFFQFRDDVCRIVHFGDQSAQSCGAEHGSAKRLFSQKLKPSALQKWLVRQLRLEGKNRVAIVAPMGGFCQYFSEKARLEILANLSKADRKGTLFLQTPPVAEASTLYLRQSPVFDALGETSITALRDAPLCDLFSSLHHDKPQRMHFLNAYTPERINDLLTRLCVASALPPVSTELLQQMQTYLLQWNNNPAFYQLECGKCRDLPPPGARYYLLYETLARGNAWTQLSRRCSELLTYGGIRDYLAKNNIPYQAQAPKLSALSRAQEGFAGKCLRLELPPSLMTSHRAAESEKLLAEIRRAAREPKNREENPKLIEAIGRFLDDYRTACFEKDGETCYYLLLSIQFCMEQLYTPQGSETERAVWNIVSRMRDCVTCSGTLFSHLQNYRNATATAKNGNLTQLALKQLAAMVDSSRKMCDRYEDAIQAAILHLQTAFSGSSMAKLAENISELLSSQGMCAEKKEEAPSAQPELQESSPLEEEYDYVIREDDYAYNPPSLQQQI